MTAVNDALKMPLSSQSCGSGFDAKSLTVLLYAQCAYRNGSPQK